MANQSYKRIINVSNRLPVKIVNTGNRITYQSSEGGLSTGLSSVFGEYENLWIGWPGCEVTNAQQQMVKDDLVQKDLHPVFLTQDEINKFYEGFSNETIWPLFHYFPTYSSYNPDYWASYLAVNKKFAAEILQFATNDDVVWVHDYHLMLLPALLREAMPEITIGYFQHIPFPSYEVFRALPWKNEILQGLLGADVVGFQTEADTQHFINAATKILDLKAKDNKFIIDDRKVNIETFPISIDYKKYADLAAHNATHKYVQKIHKSVNTKILLSIDRLDYSKGIIQRLQAFDLFLKQYPEWRQKVSLIHLVVPSRDTVKNYKELKDEMNKLISDINGKYATISWQPIKHFYRSFPPNILSALYKSADVALVTPLIDGMNLVCKEYVASNICRDGVLILSETAGAAKELKEALMINPNDATDFAQKIHEALTLPADERRHRMLAMQKTIAAADIFSWAQKFMGQLNKIKESKLKDLCIPMNTIIREQVNLSYTYANKRLILLDYDGTMVPFYKKPEDAIPDAELIDMLKSLAADKRNNVVIVSGRDSITLTKWLGHLPVNIIAEHGAWSKEKNSPWYKAPGLHTEWKRKIGQTLAVYSLATPGSFVEEKNFSLAWHYRNADTPVANEQMAKLLKDLRYQTDGLQLDVLQGNKVIEIKCSSINKGTAVSRFIRNQDYEFILAAGDDQTDEDMFKVLPEQAISIKVGSNISAAKYCQGSYLDIRSLLSELPETTNNFVYVTPILLAS